MKKMIKENYIIIAYGLNIGLFSIGALFVFLSTSGDNYFVVSEIEKQNETDHKMMKTTSSSRTQVHRSLASIKTNTNINININETNQFGEKIEEQKQEQDEEFLPLSIMESALRLQQLEIQKKQIESIEKAMIQSKFLRLQKFRESIEKDFNQNKHYLPPQVSQDEMLDNAIPVNDTKRFDQESFTKKMNYE